MYKQFLVVEIPCVPNADISFSKPFNVYDEAFEVLNNKIAEEYGQLINQPKGEKPLRAVLPDVTLELWVVNRTTDLVKA